MNQTSRGFTIIEIIFAIIILVFASTVFFIQKSNIETAARDDRRKTAINAFYYSLEEVYMKTNGSYPRTLNETTLPSVDPTLFKDADGVKIGETSSEYRYEPTNCNGDACASYTLRADLENEADFVKTQRNKN